MHLLVPCTCFEAIKLSLNDKIEDNLDWYLYQCAVKNVYKAKLRSSSFFWCGHLHFCVKVIFMFCVHAYVL